MLVELLIAIGAVMLVIVPVHTAHDANAGVGGLVLAICIGLGLAAVYELAAHKAANALDRRLQLWTESAQNWFLGMVYVGVAVFPLLVAYVGSTRMFAVLLRLR
jgi:hypothetical protein